MLHAVEERDTRTAQIECHGQFGHALLFYLAAFRSQVVAVRITVGAVARSTKA